MRTMFAAVIALLSLMEMSRASETVRTRNLISGCTGLKVMEPCMVFVAGLERGAGWGRIFFAQNMLATAKVIMDRHKYDDNSTAQMEYMDAIPKAFTSVEEYMFGCQPDEMKHYSKLGERVRIWMEYLVTNPSEQEETIAPDISYLKSLAQKFPCPPQ